MLLATRRPQTVRDKLMNCRPSCLGDVPIEGCYTGEFSPLSTERDGLDGNEIVFHEFLVVTRLVPNL